MTLSHVTPAGPHAAIERSGSDGAPGWPVFGDRVGVLGLPKRNVSSGGRLG
jgi:hypothetical protein